MSADTLGRDQIIRATVDLLDAEGTDGLSMRRLGARLGVGATSIYWYVKSKDELVALAADEVFGEIELPDPAERGWRGAAILIAHGLRSAALRHPWLAPVLGTHPVYGTRIARFQDHCLGVYEAAGFSGDDTGRAVHAVFAYVIGTTLGEASWTAYARGDGAEERAAELAARRRKIAARFPRLRGGARLPESFDFGLRVVLDGLTARLAESA
ncbi:TetR/AcrR family transcriptional regulator [Allokutzneria oryzae]|uniref:TetR/AcrR family transcriptional regulator n=1 Tax=Allokutzneria oryzae TaxID=1378989 RepID=A0ABV6A6L0_9PSEU